MNKILIGLLFLSTGLSAQSFDFSCIEEETVLGTWIPDWTNQKSSFEQTMDVYSLLSGAILETNTRTYEIIHTSDFRWTFLDAGPKLYLRSQYIDIQTGIDATKRVEYSVQWRRSYDNINGVGYSSWGPWIQDHNENPTVGKEFIQSAITYHIADFPVIIQENSSIDEVPNRTATRTVEYVPTTERISTNLNYPGGAIGAVSQNYDIVFNGEILQTSSVLLRFGLLVKKSSWETAIGIDINNDGDLFDLVERMIISYAPQQTGTYNYINVPESLIETPWDWAVTENRN